ncbi:LacI family transcriptional regulator [Paenibacillus selenitireducens]|uniref:LacI family transcriptional regulator n=1 Tax=Paenibacillus selenitireducens TaxID=1324314 RepID=A0A1T2XA72_9BACL|nr:LacI family DNA-binding transcriptional regulator [Paenibacillus selenitireducens]OPA76804.1 LacI family transcriptional regulator [Paenibacillus selenitireducens]
MKVSIFDVARKSGLSVVTVSRVLNNSPSVREKNRQRVLNAMKELDYHPNAAARSLARGKTRIVGLIATTLQDSFLDEVMREITTALESHGYFLALSVSADKQDKNHYLIQEERVDGLILLSPIHEAEYVYELNKRNLPFVLVDNQTNIPSTSSVIVENDKGGYDATKYLLELGHTKIAHIRGPHLFRSANEREKGFLRALREAGLEPFAVEQGEFSINEGYRIARKWLDEDRLPTAIFAGDDYLATGVINALLEAGIRVPEQVSVIGYDDQFLAQELRPLLTTVRQPAQQIAHHTVDIILKLIQGTLQDSVTVKLRPELIIRDSTQRLKP